MREQLEGLIGCCALVILLGGGLCMVAYVSYHSARTWPATVEAQETQRRQHREQWVLNDCQVVVFDGCQYLIYANSLTHKGNCTNHGAVTGQRGSTIVVPKPKLEE
jgi:hypothetical protein